MITGQGQAFCLAYLGYACIILAALCGLWLPRAVAANAMRGPWKHVEKKPAGDAPALLSFFQRRVSPLDGPDRCPMYPSCSHYSRQAFERYGRLKGFVLTCDRLMRCGRDETRLGPKIFVNGKMKTYDPLPKAQTKDRVPPWPRLEKLLDQKF